MAELPTRTVTFTQLNSVSFSADESLLMAVGGDKIARAYSLDPEVSSRSAKAGRLEGCRLYLHVEQCAD